MPPVSVDHAFARFCDRGDPQALATVFDLVAPGLLRVALHLTGDPHTAEDLVQETFLAAIETRATFMTGEDVEAWLLGILRNRARRTWRAREAGARVPRPTSTAGGDPLTATLASELTAEVDAAIQQLPQTYRPVLRLHLRHHLSASHIALALERPPGSVRTQIVRGLELLRQKLPRGLAVGAIAIGLAPRGLDAVRAHVLGAAGKAPVVAGSAAAFSWSMLKGSAMQKAILVGVVAAMSGLATWATGALRAPGGLVTASLAPVESRAHAQPDRDPADAPTSVSPPGRTPIAAQDSAGERRFGTVLVRARWQDNGEPAAGVTVMLHAWPHANAHLLERVGTTGARGTVRIHRVPTGEITASTDVDLYKVQVEGDREVVVDVEAKRWAKVSGTVVDADGKPVAGATVLRSGYANPKVFPVATTDADGAFALEVGEVRHLGARMAGHADSHLDISTSARASRRRSRCACAVAPRASKASCATPTVEPCRTRWWRWRGPVASRSSSRAAGGRRACRRRSPRPTPTDASVSMG